jgi:cytochrome d ubiquinol oxidase subunit I
VIVAAAALLYLKFKKVLPESKWGGRLAIALIFTPFLGNAFGWLFTEMGRQPWVVAPNPTGIAEVRLLTADAVSGSVGGWLVLFSMITFTLVYGGLGVLKKYVQAGPDAAMTGLLAGNEPVGDGDDGPRGPEDRDDWPPEGSDGPDESERLVFAY